MVPATLTRGAFLAETAVALGTPALAAELPLIPVRLGGTADTDIISTLWGVQGGVFRKYGMNLTIERLNSGGAVSAAVLGGSIEIGRSSIFGLINAHIKGVPIVLQAISAIYDKAAPNVAFVIAKNSPMSSPRELVGKTVAAPALSELFTLVSSAWIDQNGGDHKAVQYLELPITVTADAIASGKVDGAILVDPFLQIALNRGECKVLGYPFDVIASYCGVVYYFTTRSYAEQNPKACAAFRRAIAESTRYVLAHKEQMIPLVMQFTGMCYRSLSAALATGDRLRGPLQIHSGLFRGNRHDRPSRVQGVLTMREHHGASLSHPVRHVHRTWVRPNALPKVAPVWR